jgi:hypothetical protein
MVPKFEFVEKIGCELASRSIQAAVKEHGFCLHYSIFNLYVLHPPSRRDVRVWKGVVFGKDGLWFRSYDRNISGYRNHRETSELFNEIVSGKYVDYSDPGLVELICQSV